MSVYGISFHVVEVSGVLLIIVRGYRWLKVADDDDQKNVCMNS